MKNQSQWLGYIESQIGFILPTSQLQWLENAIAWTANKNNLTVDQLWDNLRTDELLKRQLVDAVLIIESRFFRHKESIDFVRVQAQLWRQKNTNTQPRDEKKFHIWSVGCSAGQEVWSLVMSLVDAHIQNFHILGSDISSDAIKTAKIGQYSRRFLHNMPDYSKCFITKVIQPLDAILGVHSEEWKVDEKLHPYVSFAINNIFLADDVKHLSSVTYAEQYDIIYCQNMLIYFRQFDQRDILARLVDRCAVGGHIVLAPNEAYFWKHPSMKRIESNQINAWKKIK